ncbi:hypothetical protein BTR22_19195 [Alkalihalophilus pseudofirmus]|uniref:hypothetical protein n=1 Tax=Alkalihalophilus pseudofirmus TaxID=79885 RepID=UPI000950CDC5|nr:hypothetical protein BTR22_19195 [Alkalihalophilus pseudofirmus]
MIPLELQDLLKERFERELDPLLLHDPTTGERTKKVTVCKQHLPKPKPSTSRTSRSDDYSQFPFLVVRINEGDIGGEEHSCRISFIAAVYDDNDDQQGYSDSMIIAQRVVSSLIRDPVVGNQFRCSGEISYVSDDEDVSPFFYAAVVTNWEIPKSISEEVEGLI